MHCSSGRSDFVSSNIPDQRGLDYRQCEILHECTVDYMVSIYPSSNPDNSLHDIQ